MLKSWLVLLISVLVFHPQVHAAKDDSALMAELTAGMIPTTEFKVGSASSDGLGASARFRYGWQIEYINLYFLYQYSYLNFSSDDITATGSQFGAGLGWEWNIPLITNIEFFGGGYSSEDTTSSLSGGFGFGVELGYFVTQRFKIVAGYNSMSFDEDETKLSMSATTVGVSFPFEINYPSTWWRTRKTDSPTKVQILENL